jgi:type IV pilus assembly protein PilE
VNRLRVSGFTLMELVVVIAIVAVVLLLALPAYQQQLRNGRRALGSAQLLQVMMRQEQFYLDHKGYAGELTELGYPANPYAIDAQGSAVLSAAGNRIYHIELTTYRGGYTLFAIPQLEQSGDVACGMLSLDSSGVKRATGAMGVRGCW